MLAEETILSRNLNNIIFGSVLLPMGEEKGKNDDLTPDSSDGEDEKIFKDRMFYQKHKTRSEFTRRSNIPESHKSLLMRGIEEENMSKSFEKTILEESKEGRMTDNIDRKSANNESRTSDDEIEQLDD